MTSHFSPMNKFLQACTVLGLVLTGTYSHAGAKDTPSIQFYTTESSSTPFSPAVRVGNTLYLSGQLGLLPGTAKIAPGGAQAETRQALQNIKGVLTSSGYKMSDVVKCTVFLTDMADFSDFNKEYLSSFSKPYPARSAIGVKSLAFGGRVEIECVAAK